MIEIRAVGPDALERYGRVSIAYEVRSILAVEAVERGLGGICFSETRLEKPYRKDYDQDEHPTDWPNQFDLSNWIFFLAEDAADASTPAAAAAVAWNTPMVNMLEQRTDLAVLWDIRVQPQYRGQGLGARLFQQAEDWARARGCTQLKVETQNINPNACRFYARMGCVLGGIQQHAYPEPNRHEVMLLWYKNLRDIPYGVGQE